MIYKSGEGQGSYLVYFHIGIDFAHEEIRAHIADGAADDAEGAAKESHVAKVEGRLEQTKHSAKVEYE